MTNDDFATYIEKRISPYDLRENRRASLSLLFKKYPEELLLECVNIGIKQYFRYDNNGVLTKDSVETFLNKLGGIAFNKSQSPIKQEFNHIKNTCCSIYNYWDTTEGIDILEEYVSELRKVNWTEEQILSDLQNDVKRLCNRCRNWQQWSTSMRRWISDVKSWRQNDVTKITQSGAVLPNEIFVNIPQYLQVICKQINASFENNLYDCSAVMMRRLLETLLVLSYQNLNIESEITEKRGKHFSLDKMIKNAVQNSKLALSSNTKQDMTKIKNIGNYSAHKIWYHATRSDIEKYITDYRLIIEELLCKAGLN